VAGWIYLPRQKDRRASVAGAIKKPPSKTWGLQRKQKNLEGNSQGLHPSGDPSTLKVLGLKDR